MRKLISLCVGLGLLLAQGCAKRATSQQMPPDAPANVNQQLLSQLVDARTRLEAEISDAEQRLAKFRQQHPDFQPREHTTPDEISQLSEMYLRAIARLLEAQAEYPAGHPRILTAQQIVDQMGKLHALAVAVSALTAEYEKLEIELVTKQMFYGRLEGRIRELEMASR